MMPAAVPGIAFAMRYQDDIGFVWNTIGRLADETALQFHGRLRGYAAYPRLTDSPAFRPKALSRIEVDFYDTSAANRRTIEAAVQQHHLTAVSYVSSDPAALDVRWLRSLGLETICYEQESYPVDARQPLWKWLAKSIVRRGLRRNIHDLYVANAHHQRTFLLNFAALPPSRVITIVNGVDTSRFCPGDAPDPATLGLPQSTHYALVVCQARPEKRLDFVLDTAVEVFRRQPELSLTFVHVGAGETLEASRQKAAALGLGDRFVFAGFHNDVRPFHRIATFLVHAAARESFGLVLAEAMACGKPVLATRSAGPEEIIADGETGRILPPDSVYAFADAVLELTGEPEKCERWGRAARSRAVDSFSLHRQAEAFGKLLLERADASHEPR
jgi:glycosyltransferase involved in cell wall biosynthesis